MRCEEIHERLSAYLEGEIDAAARERIAEHLETCAHCRQELALLQRTVSTLQSLEEIDVPPRLTAEIRAGIHGQRAAWWRQLVTRIFYPVHIKVPIEAMVLLLIALGAVYLFRTSPELARAPEPQAPAASKTARIDRSPSLVTEGTRGQDEIAIRKESAEMRQIPAEQQKAREKFDDRDVGTFPRRELESQPAPAAPPLPELMLKTQNPARAASRIAEIAAKMGGRLDKTQGEHRFILTIPAQAYPKFLIALRDLGEVTPRPTDALAEPTTQKNLTFSLRLTR
ncbi:MAG: zf-HC2 domain-containing protein [Candidatus Methylomirabilales bacterium]